VSVFGTIILPETVENAITELFKTWMDTYLREIERITGRDAGQLPSIRAWGLGDVEERLEEQQPPALMVECAKAKMHETADSYSAAWDTTLAIITKSHTMNDSRRLAGLYTTAACLIAVQQPLGLGVMGWEEQDYGILTVNERRFLARGEARFTTTVSEVVQTEAGPTEPEQEGEPLSEYPLVDEINVTVNPE
jgi:hypothetical protein